MLKITQKILGEIAEDAAEESILTLKILRQRPKKLFLLRVDEAKETTKDVLEKAAEAKEDVKDAAKDVKKEFKG